jgi:hypothetical protein
MEAVNGISEENITRAHLIKIGDIITLKKPMVFKGDEYWQIAIMKIEFKKKSVRLIGLTSITKWYNSFQELNNEIDWEWMDKWIID